MRPKHSHTGYGVWDISRQVARRVQQAWESVESPSGPRDWRRSELVRLPAPPTDPRKKETRPLAA